LDDGLKQRLVGAIVLIVLAALVLPAVLQEPQNEASLADPIPDRPKFEVVTSIVKDTNQARRQLQARLDKERASYGSSDSTNTAQAELGGETPSAASSLPSDSNSDLVRQSAAPLSPAWSIQVASFGNKDNARKLQQKLLKADYRAYVNRFNVNGEPVYRVMIGPDIQKERAERALAKLAQNMQIQGMLVRYHP